MVVFVFVLGMFLLRVGAQQYVDVHGIRGWILPAVVENGDTLPVVTLPPAIVYGDMVFPSDEDWLLYQKIKYRFLKVYPYAVEAALMYMKHAAIVDSLETRRAKRKYARKVQKEIMDTYFEEVKKLTIPEGDVLIKLISYFTGKTPYDIIKEYRGGVHAFFWQRIAQLWDHDLKATIDTTKKEDKYLMYLIRLKQEGLL